MVDNYVEHTEQEKRRLLNEVRDSAIKIAEYLTRRDKDYQYLPRQERAVKYLGEVIGVTSNSQDDKDIIAFIEGKKDTINGYGLSVMMAALGCPINDIMPSVRPSKDKHFSKMAAGFRGIGSYWDAFQFITS